MTESVLVLWIKNWNFLFTFNFLFSAKTLSVWKSIALLHMIRPLELVSVDHNYLLMNCLHFFQFLSYTAVVCVIELATKVMLILIFYRKEPRTVPLIHEEASSNIERQVRTYVLSSMAMSFLTDCSLNCRYDFLELFSLCKYLRRVRNSFPLSHFPHAVFTT